MQYSTVTPGSFIDRLSNNVRGELYARFIRECGVGAEDTILDVGVTADAEYLSVNYLEALHPNKAAITACGIEDASFLEEQYPGLTFVHADGLDLPFDDRSFDFVHSSAVIEHVGCEVNQRRFVSECARVARRGVFLTTPNRWFPVEFHTKLPLLHWLPKPLFRRIIRATPLAFFGDETNLNLLGAPDLRRFGVPGVALRVGGHRLFGLTSNLILIGSRKWGSEARSAARTAKRAPA